MRCMHCRLAVLGEQSAIHKVALNLPVAADFAILIMLMEDERPAGLAAQAAAALLTLLQRCPHPYQRASKEGMQWVYNARLFAVACEDMISRMLVLLRLPWFTLGERHPSSCWDDFCSTPNVVLLIKRPLWCMQLPLEHCLQSSCWS